MKTQEEISKEIIHLNRYLINTTERIKSGTPKKGDKALCKTLRNDIKTLKWVLGIEKHVIS